MPINLIRLIVWNIVASFGNFCCVWGISLPLALASWRDAYFIFLFFYQGFLNLSHTLDFTNNILLLHQYIIIKTASVYYVSYLGSLAKVSSIKFTICQLSTCTCMYLKMEIFWVGKIHYLPRKWKCQILTWNWQHIL